MPKFNNPKSYEGRNANQKRTGQARFATAAEAASGAADDLLISPLTLSTAVDDLLPDASQTVKGKVELATAGEMSAGTSQTLVPAVKVIKDYVDGVAVAGAPVSDVGVLGIASIATDAQAVAGTANNPGVTAYIVTPSNLAAVFAAPPAMGGTTPAAATVTNFSASGTFALSGDQVQVTEGGTGAATAGDARTNLGLVIGTDVQAYDADLAAIGALAKTDGNIIVGNGSTWVAESGATARASLGLVINTDVQGWDQALTDISGLAVTDGNIIVADGVNWVAESGATARASLGLTIGTNVQAYDAGLADIAGLAVTDGNIIVGDGVNWVAESGATARTSLGLGTIATQAANSVSITGGSITGITDLAVDDGGTGASSLTDHGVLCGSGTAAVTALSVGTNGQVLVGSTGADPVFATIGSANTSIAGTLGAGTLSLDVDESYLQVATVSISTGELLALMASPKTLIAAPGADKIIMFESAMLVLDYNSVPYTESADNLAIKYTNGSGAQVSEDIETTNFIDQTADTVTNAVPKKDAIVAASGCVNQALVLHNIGDSEFGAGNSPLDVRIAYRVVTAGL